MSPTFSDLKRRDILAYAALHMAKPVSPQMSATKPPRYHDHMVLKLLALQHPDDHHPRARLAPAFFKICPSDSTAAHMFWVALA